MSKLTPADIMRVKGLGCLKDKRFDDIFNVRVITRNGKITTDEQVIPLEERNIKVFYDENKITLSKYCLLKSYEQILLTTLNIVILPS